jgi:hypothetical protein
MSYIPGPGDLWLADAEAREELSQLASEQVGIAELADTLGSMDLSKLLEALNDGDWLEIGRIIAVAVEQYQEICAQEESRQSQYDSLDFTVHA